MAQITQDGKTYIDLTTLAADTGYDREYLRKLAKSGKVDAIQIDYLWLINPDSLNEYSKGYKSRGSRKSARGKTGPKPKPKAQVYYEPFRDSA